MAVKYRVVLGTQDSYWVVSSSDETLADHQSCYAAAKTSMKDLTTNSIPRHLVRMAIPVLGLMVTQIAYQLIDLYFVARIGVGAVAGVNGAVNITLIASVPAQILGIGTSALIAQAAGRREQHISNLILNQSLALAIAAGVLSVLLLVPIAYPYMKSITADETAFRAGMHFLWGALPACIIMYPVAILSSALRGTGVVHVTTAILVLTIVINCVLAPILIAGWITHRSLGAFGAGAATSCSALIGLVLFVAYVKRFDNYLLISVRSMRPQFGQWLRIATIGLPAGGELILLFLSTCVALYAIRDLGAATQAGFSIGSRLLQLMLLPGLAVALAAGPIAGQNTGARDGARVIQTFRSTVLICTLVMAAMTALAQLGSRALVGFFDIDAPATEVAESFVRIVSWTFVAQGFVYACHSMFQGFANIMPTLVSGAIRFLAFAIPALGLMVAMRPPTQVQFVWYLIATSVVLEAAACFALLRDELRRRNLYVQAMAWKARLRFGVNQRRLDEKI